LEKPGQVRPENPAIVSKKAYCLDSMYKDLTFYNDKQGEEAPNMEEARLSIPNISCHHCITTIQRELGEMEGVHKVEGDPDTKEISVEWSAPATLDKVKSTLEAINYPAAD
jgi:copper chaperone